MRKIYRMALELGLAAALVIPELTLMIFGGDVYQGTIQLNPEDLMTMQQMHGALVMILGWSCLNMVCLIMVANMLVNYRNKMMKLEGEKNGTERTEEER